MGPAGPPAAGDRISGRHNGATGGGSRGCTRSGAKRPAPAVTAQSGYNFGRMVKRVPVWIYVLPVLHLFACITIALANLESGVHYLIYIYLDFPFSLVLVMLGWRNDSFLILFAILGTCWWWLLSWLSFYRLRK